MTEPLIITSFQTNKLFLSPLLKIKYPTFWNHFNSALKQNNIDYHFIPFTKDVWVTDFMPVQVTNEKLIRFQYKPSYLTGRYKETITDNKAICAEMKITTIDSEIIFEGGNVTQMKNKVLISERVLAENEKFTGKELVKELEKLFECAVIIIPVEPNDFTGHADGMIRNYKDNIVLVNDYSFHKRFEKRFHKYLAKAEIKFITVPYYGFENKSVYDACGMYINYLHLQKYIFLPVFNLATDNAAIEQFEKLFPDDKVVPVLCNDLAKDGGAVNCISWNIKK